MNENDGKIQWGCIAVWSAAVLLGAAFWALVGLGVYALVDAIARCF